MNRGQATRVDNSHESIENDSIEDFRDKTIDTNDQERDKNIEQNLDQLMLIEDDCDLFGNNYII